MDLGMTTLGEASQKEKDKDLMMSLICGILKSDTNELIYKTGTLTDTENKLTVTKGERGEGIS